MSEGTLPEGPPPLGVSLIPSEATHTTLTTFIRDLSCKEDSAPIFLPHITLFYPILKEGTDMKTLAKDLELIVDSVKEEHGKHAWTFKLGSAQAGPSYYRSVVAPVEPSSEHDDRLPALRSACETKWSQPGREKKTYFPHLSLLYGHITEERKDQLAEIANMGLGIDCKLTSEMAVDRLWVVDTAGSVEQWTCVKTVDL